MGIFSKLKNNFTHGGVKIDMQVPGSASLQDATLPVIITLTSTDAQQTVNKIKLKLISEKPGEPTGQPGATGPAVHDTVAEAYMQQPTVIMPGETKSFDMQLGLNAGAFAQEHAGEMSDARAGLANVMGKLQTVAQALDNADYHYYVEAVADVEGITLDPSVRRPIIMTKAGQIGGGFSAQL